jgi:hypothetical protein
VPLEDGQSFSMERVNVFFSFFNFFVVVFSVI